MFGLDAVLNVPEMVSYSTFQKWQTELDKGSQMVTMVAALKCGICARFQSALQRRRNYSDKWIAGVESLRTSNIRDHAIKLISTSMP